MEMLLDRALYKRIKAMNKTEMNNFIQNIYAQAKEDSQAHSIDYDTLKADLARIKGIGESRLNEIMAVIDKHIESVNDE